MRSFVPIFQRAACAPEEKINNASHGANRNFCVSGQEWFCQGSKYGR
jgi:hypothetical protein